MPQAPDTYRKAKHEGTEQHGNGSEHGQQRGGGGLYQSYRYIKFRASVKKRQRAIDEERVHKIYSEKVRQEKKRSYKDYEAWREDEKKNPLCVSCLAEGMIKPGRVMDHIQPIERGGSVWSRDNLQWLCDRHHNLKRATEDRK